MCVQWERGKSRARRHLWALGDDGEKGSANASARAVTVGRPLPDGLHGSSVGTEAREARRTLRLREMAAFTATLLRVVFMQRQEARDRVRPV